MLSVTIHNMRRGPHGRSLKNFVVLRIGLNSVVNARNDDHFKKRQKRSYDNLNIFLTELQF